MSNETLILKTAVSTNSTVKLTDCPMSAGEILEMVYRLYANGLTSGNRCFKAIGNAVTYNTDAVTEGDIYCVSYRDGGFYVGLRTTEDYEPKEGDWWCYFNQTRTGAGTVTQNGVRYIDVLRGIDIGLFADEYYLNSNKWFYVIIGNAITANPINTFYYLSYKNDSYSISSSSTVGNKYIKTPEPNSSVADYLYGYVSGTTNYAQKGLIVRAISDDPNITPLKATALMFKPISVADLLAYQNTGKMGALMLSDAIDKSVAVSSNVLASLSAIAVDGTAVSCKQVGNLYITNTAVSGLVTSIGDVYKVLKDDTENV